MTRSQWADKITRLALGAAQFGNLGCVTSDEASTEAVQTAWAAGIRYFDTAPHYGLGLSERRLGAALRDMPRSDYVLSTKVGRLLVDAPGAEGMDDEGFMVPATTRREWDLSRDGIRRSLEQSMGRLGVDHVDIVYLHDPDDHRRLALDEALPALVELRDEGIVSAIGAGMNQSAMLAEFVREFDLDVVMCAGRFTLLEQSAMDDLLPLALERGTKVVAAGVYNSGLLSAPTVREGMTYDYAPAPRPLIEKARSISAICETHGATLPQVAAQFPFRHPVIASVVLGMRTADHVRSNADRAVKPVDPALWRSLAEAGIIPESLG